MYIYTERWRGALITSIAQTAMFNDYPNFFIFRVFLIPWSWTSAEVGEREVRPSANHESDWLRDHPSNRMGTVPGAYHVSYEENFKLREAGHSLIGRLFVQWRRGLRRS